MGRTVCDDCARKTEDLPMMRCMCECFGKMDKVYMCRYDDSPADACNAFLERGEE